MLSALPPRPADVEKDISVCTVPLAAAVDTAVKAAGGIARSAEIQVANGKPMIRVWIYGGGACKRVDVDGQSGEIASTIDVPRFPGEPVDGQWTETTTGLLYYDLVTGTGAKPRDPMAKVKVHYTGWLVDGTRFETSRDRSEPVELALSKVIVGWREGLSTMQVGGKRKLIIPSGLGYGPKGSRSVPPNAVTIFDVELVDVMN
ncbi:MAG: FKBP-type peptidyl-prolyl cis-trans isomerase [Planctomycetota bacterium]